MNHDNAISTGEAAFDAARGALLQISGMTTIDAHRYASCVLGAAIPVIAAGFMVKSDAAMDEAMQSFEAKLRTQLAAVVAERDRLQTENGKYRHLLGDPASSVRVVAGLDGTIRIATHDHVSDENLAILIAWCEANDIDAGLIPGDSVICVHDGQIEFEERIAVTVGPNGAKGFRAEDLPVRRTVPLVVPIPSEWIRWPRE